MNSFANELTVLINSWIAKGDTAMSIMKDLARAGEKLSSALFDRQANGPKHPVGKEGR